MTRTRIHLAATVPNEGARRLAWFIGEDRRADAVERLAANLKRDAIYIDRLIAGDVEPGADVANAVFRATEGKVWRRDWRTKPRGWWFDRPAQRRFDRRQS